MIIQCVEAERCIIYLETPPDLLQVKCMTGTNPQNFSIKNDFGAVGYAFKIGNPLFIRNPYGDKRFEKSIDNLRKAITKNILCVPIKVGIRSIGVIEITNKITGDFTEIDIKLISFIAKQISPGIQQLAQKQKLTEMTVNQKRNQIKILESSKQSLITPLLRNMLSIIDEVLTAER